MRDLNFFLPYIESNKESKKTNVILYILTVLILMYVVGTTVWYFSSKIILNDEYKKIKSRNKQYSYYKNSIKRLI